MDQLDIGNHCSGSHSIRDKHGLLLTNKTVEWVCLNGLECATSRRNVCILSLYVKVVLFLHLHTLDETLFIVNRKQANNILFPIDIFVISLDPLWLQTSRDKGINLFTPHRIQFELRGERISPLPIREPSLWSIENEENPHRHKTRLKYLPT